MEPRKGADSIDPYEIGPPRRLDQSQFPKRGRVTIPTSNLLGAHIGMGEIGTATEQLYKAVADLSIWR